MLVNRVFEGAAIIWKIRFKTRVIEAIRTVFDWYFDAIEANESIATTLLCTTNNNIILLDSCSECFTYRSGSLRYYIKCWCVEWYFFLPLVNAIYWQRGAKRQLFNNKSYYNIMQIIHRRRIMRQRMIRTLACSLTKNHMRTTR